MSSTPEWFEMEIAALRNSIVFGNPESLAEHLDAACRDMYENLTALHSQVRTMLLFTLAPFAATIALLSATSGQSMISFSQLLMLAGAVLLLTLP